MRHDPTELGIAGALAKRGSRVEPQLAITRRCTALPGGSHQDVDVIDEAFAGFTARFRCHAVAARLTISTGETDAPS